MQSENDKPDAAESRPGEPKALDLKGRKLNPGDPQIMNPEIAGPENAKAASRDSEPLQAVPVRNKMTERRFADNAQGAAESCARARIGSFCRSTLSTVAGTCWLW
jgi:hypothetical protein